MKEYGGQLPLDIYGKEFYDRIEGGEILRMNAARYAIAEAFVDGEFSRLWVPVYTCKTVTDALKAAGIPYSFYNIDENFEPDVKATDSRECILITNYFGIFGRHFYQRMLARYDHIIFDHTQSFYAEPVLQKKVYNVYSPRKFFGVSDGAYLITSSFEKKHILEEDVSCKRAFRLLKALEFGANSAYADYLAGEDELAEDGAKKMSVLTRSLLSNINYESVCGIRNHNYGYLHEKLKMYNQLPIPNTGVCPQIYPLLLNTGDGVFRRYLVDHRIFIPQWWKRIISSQDSNEWEKHLAVDLYPLPIDQRYQEADMDDMVSIIISGLERRTTA